MFPLNRDCAGNLKWQILIFFYSSVFINMSLSFPQQPSSNQSGLICQLHDLLNDIVSGSSRGERLVRGDRQYTFDVLDMLVKKVTSSRCGFKVNGFIPAS